MTKKILLLHAWFATPDSHWYPWLRDELTKRGYEVAVPFLRDNEKPTLASWMRSALRNHKLDKNTLVIGHSLGAVLALRLVEQTRTKIAGLITVSGWDFWSLVPEHRTFFKNNIDHKRIIARTSKRTVIHADDDPYFTEYTAREFAKRIKANCIILKKKGHFTKDSGVIRFPELIWEVEAK
ncbi:MAG: alpha/beta fold hydrolase [Candidatus Dojkabacteria bacterium]|nr:alpha/beta fold hydrolase [Candidatus Dojkabacteria bacterium]